MGRRQFVALLLAVLVGCVKHGAGEPLDTGPFPMVVYVTRHTEKSAGSDPDLAKEGLARAQALMRRMADVPLVAIYSTDYNRTRQTVEPTAADHGLNIDVSWDPTDELADHLLVTHDHEQVLVCGHSNTVPDLLGALGMEEPPDIGDDDYGTLWILSRLGEQVVVESEDYGR